MDFYRIVGPECGRNRYGDFKCICGRCEKLPEGSTHDEVVGHPAKETTTHREDDDNLMSRIAMLEERTEYLKQYGSFTRRWVKEISFFQTVFCVLYCLHLIHSILFK